VQFISTFVVYAAALVILMRLGLLVAVASLFTRQQLDSVTTTNFTAWYGQGPFLSVLVLSALALCLPHVARRPEAGVIS
jgi:hypothetical protein